MMRTRHRRARRVADDAGVVPGPGVYRDLVRGLYDVAAGLAQASVEFRQFAQELALARTLSTDFARRVAAAFAAVGGGAASQADAWAAAAERRKT